MISSNLKTEILYSDWLHWLMGGVCCYCGHEGLHRRSSSILPHEFRSFLALLCRAFATCETYQNNHIAMTAIITTTLPVLWKNSQWEVGQKEQEKRNQYIIVREHSLNRPRVNVTANDWFACLPQHENMPSWKQTYPASSLLNLPTPRAAWTMPNMTTPTTR